MIEKNHETIYTSTMRSGAQKYTYLPTFKEFELEELLQETLPEYFNINDIEQILKIDV